MRRQFAELFQNSRVRRPQHAVYSVGLVQLIVAREKREQCNDLEHHTPHSPNIHFIIVVPIG